jgi:septal ring factor EnvC (AmiA/AmiB activator)
MSLREIFVCCSTTKSIKDLKSVIADARSDIDSLRKGAEERAKELEKLTARLQDAETAIEKLPPMKTVEAAAAELDKERAYAAQQVQAFDDKRDAVCFLQRSTIHRFSFAIVTLEHAAGYYPPGQQTSCIAKEAETNNRFSHQ